MAKEIIKKASKVKSIAINKPAKPAFRSDTKQTATLVKVGRSAAVNAVRASKALGLPITYMKNGEVIKEMADGTKKVIVAAANNPKKQSVALKKGMVFYAKK
jgi:ribosomal protein L30E